MESGLPSRTWTQSLPRCSGTAAACSAAPKTARMDAWFASRTPKATAGCSQNGTNPEGGLEQRLRIDVDRPWLARVLAQDATRVVAAQHDMKAPAIRATRDIGGHRTKDGDVRSPRALTPTLGCGASRRLRLLAILERHGELDQRPERR